MSSPLKNTNTLIGSLVVIGILLAVIFSQTEESGLAATGTIFMTAGVLVTWPIIRFIERRAVKKAPVALTEAQLKRFKLTRNLILLGLVALIAYAVIIN